MKQKLTALLLTLAMICSICAISAIAGETPAEENTSAGETQPAGEGAEDAESAGTGESGESAGAEEEVRPPVYPAGPDRTPAVDPETGELLEEVTIVPDEVGTVTFANLERRMREKNLQLNAIEENVLIIEDIDYDDMYEDLRKQLNEIAKMQWGLVLTESTLHDYGQFGGQYEMGKSYEQLEQAYDAIRDTFDSIKDGDLQKDNADVVWQLNSLEDQIVMGGEALYVALAGLEIQEAGLQRQLTALNRTMEEMDLRYQMGQISALQLSQASAGRSSLVSGLETLRMNIANYKLQLELMIGAEQTGSITLGTLPEVTAEELEKMNLEEDLLTAKTNSYALHEAALTLEDAAEAYDDAGGNGYPDPEEYAYKKAKHTWNSAQYTYNNTLQEFELKFRTLYAQVQDCYQIWNTAQVSLASEQHSFQASELKYQQGTISRNAYLDAQDSLAAAEETVKTAANDLFSTYNTYCWAVQHGILN